MTLVMALIVVVVGGVGVASVYRSGLRALEFREISDQARFAQVRFKIQVQEWKNILLRGIDPGDFEKYRGRFEKEQNTIQVALQKLQEIELIRKDPSLVADIENLRKRHEALGQQYSLALRVYPERGAVGVDRLVRGIDRQPTKHFDRIVERVLEREEEEIAESIEYAVYFVVAVLVFGLGLSVFFGWAVIRSINRPMRRLVEIIESLGEGDFTVNTAGLGAGGDEIADLARAEKRMMDKVGDLILSARTAALAGSESADDISEFAGRLKDNAAQLAATAEENSASVEEMHATLSTVSESIAGAGEVVREVESSVGRLKKFAAEFKRETADLQNLSLGASERAEKTDLLIGEITVAMNTITEGIERITEILAMIDEISERTNLLSLNASIEAARAGDAGRGFAVVAGEISRLAETTADHTRSIKEVAGQVGDHTRQAGQNVRESVEVFRQVAGGVREIASKVAGLQNFSDQQTGNMAAVSERMQGFADRFQGIETASAEQKATATEIMRATQAVTESSQQLAESADRLGELSAGLKVNADHLRETMGVFRLARGQT